MRIRPVDQSGHGTKLSGDIALEKRFSISHPH